MARINKFSTGEQQKKNRNTNDQQFSSLTARRKFMTLVAGLIFRTSTSSRDPKRRLLIRTRSLAVCNGLEM